VLAADTSPEAHRVQCAIWRRMTPSERVRAAADMSEDARRITLAGIAHRRPELSPRQRLHELVRLMHGVALPVEPSG
jgi:hypothetical protein